MSTQTAVPTLTHAVSTKVAAGASALFAVSFFLTVASIDVPHNAPGAVLLAWWQDPANQRSGIVSMLSAVSAAICFIVVADYFRALVASAGARAGQLTQFAHSMAMAFGITLLVSAALRGTIGHLVKVDGEPLPGLDVLRLITSMNYTLLGTVGMTVLGISILAMSVVIIRTLVLPKWVGILGLACAGVILGASAILRGQYAISLSLLWALALALVIWRQPRH